MKKKNLLFFIFLPFIAFSQNNKLGHDIQFAIQNYLLDSLYVGYYYGKESIIVDTLRSKGENSYRWKDDNHKLPTGVYFIQLADKRLAFDFLLSSNEDQYFDIKSDLNTQEITGSNENTYFNDYNVFMQTQLWYIDRMKKDQHLEKLPSLYNAINEYQNNVIEKHPNAFTTALIKAQREVPLPAQLNVDKWAKFRYYQKHYFDNTPIADARLINTPYLIPKIRDYLYKLTPQVPDSVNLAIDYLLKESKKDTSMYHFMSDFLLDEFAANDIIGYDACYVHIAKKYYPKNIATWMPDAQLAKILHDATILDKILIGKIAPDFTIERKEGTKLRLHDIKADYTVLVFWKPDCEHCRKSLPQMAAFYEKYRTKGVEVVAICSKFGKDNCQKCWDFLNDKPLMLQWVNAADPLNAANVQVTYDVRFTPQVFILDKDKRIVMKKFAMEEIETTFLEIKN